MKWIPGNTPEEMLKNFLNMILAIIILISLGWIYSHFLYLDATHNVYYGCMTICENITGCSQRCYTYFMNPKAREVYIQTILYPKSLGLPYENPHTYDFLEGTNEYGNEDPLVYNVSERRGIFAYDE